MLRLLGATTQKASVTNYPKSNAELRELYVALLFSLHWKKLPTTCLYD
jgi:hypothetical protein